MKYPAIYIRVSTDAQAEEGYSIEAQKEQLSAYCISKGMKNYQFYIDGGWSGSNIERPEMERMIEDAKKDKISHVIVYKLDRLSRSQKDTLYLIEEVFMPHNIAFISITETLDTSTPMGRAMIGILAAFAQLERENIKMRTRMGMKERVKTGLWMGGARIPFGYDYDKNKGILVPNKNADKVRQIYKLYIDGYSGQKIADMLGLKYEQTVMEILTHKCNYGLIEYKGEIYKGKHEPIIDEETYNKAAECMNKRKIIKTPASIYLLTGLCYCGKCGAKMRYQKWGKKVKIVCYSQQTGKQYLVKDPNCNQPKIYSDEIEDKILSFLFSLKDGDLKKKNTQIQNNLIDVLNKEKEDANKKLKKLYVLYTETDDDDILLNEIKNIKNELKTIDEKIEQEHKKHSLSKIANKKIENLKEAWDFMTQEERQQIIRILIKKVTITDYTITVDTTF